MKIVMLLIFLGCVELACCAHAVPASAKLKYPYPLLTNDYGILNELDLAAYTWGLKPRPFTAEKYSGGYSYWQCFRHEQVSIILEDTGSSSEDVGWRDTLGDLIIRVQVTPDLTHDYIMRARWTVDRFETDFNRWRKLMKDENFVCLGGGFIKREHKIENGRKKEAYFWTFEKIKTKKGCDAYFNDYDGCNPSYNKYLQDIEKLNQREA